MRGHHQFCECFLTPLPIFWKSNWKVHEVVCNEWPPSALWMLFDPPPSFFGNRTGKFRRWWAMRGHHQLCECFPPPPIFWKSNWEVQEVVGTLTFVCAFSPFPPNPLCFLTPVRFLSPYSQNSLWNQIFLNSDWNQQKQHCMNCS